MIYNHDVSGIQPVIRNFSTKFLKLVSRSNYQTYISTYDEAIYIEFQGSPIFYSHCFKCKYFLLQ